MSKNQKIYLVIIAFAILIIGVIVMLHLNPFQQSEEKIREYMLENIPIGTSMEEVIDAVEKKSDWTIDIINEEYGYGVDRYGVPGFDYYKEVGVKSLRILIDDGILYSSQVYCGFDENSKLIEFAVTEGMNL